MELPSSSSSSVNVFSCVVLLNNLFIVVFVLISCNSEMFCGNDVDETGLLVVVYRVGGFDVDVVGFLVRKNLI